MTTHGRLRLLALRDQNDAVGEAMARQRERFTTLLERDFLQCTVEQLGGAFDGILMNPPFKNAMDMKHIRHALTLLKPGGRILALCYAGPRQQAAFRNVNGWTWTELEPGSFRSEGTGAAVAMITRTNAG